MFRYVTLASGSSGNCALAEYGKTRILIDAGISFARIKKALELLEIPPESLNAVLLTHEHTDHVSGLATLLKRVPLPVYTGAGTFEALAERPLFERLPKSCFYLMKGGESVWIGEGSATALPVRHDAAEPFVFRLDTEEAHFASVTDLGCFDEALVEALQGLDALLLETNHDRRMLQMGPYPYPLKLRIDSEIGHLSNEAGAELLKRVLHPGLREVILGHLSQTNNYPPLAEETVRSLLMEAGEDPDRLHLQTAPPAGFSGIIRIQEESGS